MKNITQYTVQGNQIVNSVLSMLIKVLQACDIKNKVQKVVHIVDDKIEPILLAKQKADFKGSVKDSSTIVNTTNPSCLT